MVSKRVIVESAPTLFCPRPTLFGPRPAPIGPGPALIGLDAPDGGHRPTPLRHDPPEGTRFARRSGRRSRPISPRKETVLPILDRYRKSRLPGPGPVASLVFALPSRHPLRRAG